MKLYGEISKSEKQDDGTLKVWGYASSAAVDSDGETITAEAMKAALPDYMKFGAVREMHGKSAAGTAIEARVEDDGRTFFGAHVVDPIAVKKCEHGVYKGFSIGGKVTKRDDLVKTTITGLNLVEVSLVDRPANPEAIFTVFKADSLVAEEAVDELAKMLDTGVIGPAQLLELAKTAQATAAPVVETAADAVATPEAGHEAEKAAETQPGAASQAADPVAPVEDAAAVPAPAEAVVVDVVALAAQHGDIIKGAAAGAIAVEHARVAAAAVHAAVAKANTDHEAAVAALRKSHDDALGAARDDAVASLAKVAGELDLAKAAVATLTAERDELAKRNATLAAMPVPGKALLKALAKGEDVEGTTPAAVEKVTRLDGTESEVASLIKAAQRVPLVR